MNLPSPSTPARPRGGTSRRLLVGACLVALLAPAACTGASDGASGDGGATSGSDADLASYYGQRIEWRPCEGGFECGKVTVPLDYDNPGGTDIELAVVRLPATEPDNRIGSLVLNPGGPGASGVDFARGALSLLGERVRARFDVVGFDPRGVGDSAPIHCLADDALDRYLALDTSPDTAEERSALVRQSRSFAEGCAERSGRLVPHVDTVSAARDMDVLRSALGDDALSYLGLSYGTELGAAYAELFPRRVRALVLDGAVDPSLTSREMGLGQAEGFEEALRAFVSNCVEQSACPLGSSGVDAAYERLDELLARLDQDPVPVPGQDGRELTQGLATFGIAAGLYDQRYWPRLRRALRMAIDDDGSGLVQLADSLAGRQPDGSYTNMTEANTAISCVDESLPDDVSAYAQFAGRAEEQSPHFGGYIAWSALPCAFWPVSAADDVAIDGSGAPPILVIGTTQDPATPYAWAEGLAGQLDSGRLLTREGYGHTAFGQGNSCIDRAVRRYLIETDAPEPGTVCET